MGWRPDGWKNPYLGDTCLSIWPDYADHVNLDGAGDMDIFPIELRHAYEAGADAMLKALRKKRFPVRDNIFSVVEIPDDPK